MGMLTFVRVVGQEECVSRYSLSFLDNELRQM
jgi:hypothetical protein